MPYHSEGSVRESFRDLAAAQVHRADKVGDLLEPPPRWVSESRSRSGRSEVRDVNGHAGEQAELRDGTRGLLGYQLLPTDDHGDQAEPQLVEGLTPGAFGPASSVGFIRGMQVCVMKVLQSGPFQLFTVCCIVANAVVIGLETDMPEPAWRKVELGFLCLFAAELGMRLFVQGPKRYFCGEGEEGCQQAGNRPRTPVGLSQSSNSDVAWNIFDFVVVGTGFLCLAASHVVAKSTQGNGDDESMLRLLRLLRLLRILRVIRMLRFLKQLYLLAYGFMEGALAVFWVAVLAAVSIYVCAVVLVRIFRSRSPEDPGYEFLEVHFSNIPRAMFSLFEIMASPTLGHYREVLMECPFLAMFTVVFVIFGSFGMNGLLTGVITESMIDKNQARVEAQRKEREAKRRLLERFSEELFEAAVMHGGCMTKEEFMWHKEDIVSLVQEAGGLPPADPEQLFQAIDISDRGRIGKAEFVHGMLELCEDIRPMSIMELHSQVVRCNSKIEALASRTDLVLASCLSQPHVNSEMGQSPSTNGLCMRCRESSGPFALHTTMFLHWRVKQRDPWRVP